MTTLRSRLPLGVLLALALVSCQRGDVAETGGAGEEAMAIQITSPAFEQGRDIPVRHTCDGEDLSPQLDWSGVPEGAKSLALVCEDPDAPVGNWVHWVIYGLPSVATGLPEGVAASTRGAAPALQGVNDFKRPGYGGPCPPRGNPHRYFFRLYALDAVPDLGPGATRQELARAIEGHVVARGELMGRYARR